MSDLDKVLATIDADLDAALERLFVTLRLKSISTDPAYAAETRACAEWHAADLREIGFDASVARHPRPSDGRRPPARRATGPSVLFYGHYDVQPVDPLELWDNDPFDPKIVTRPDGSKMLVGRGTADDKGQLMTFVEACRAWKTVTGKLPVPVTVLLEGEEESGGVNLPPFLDANLDELRADIALICDTNMWDADTPAITTSLRGLCGEEIVIHAADRDLHSGFYGSAATNPNHVLARIIADLRDADGRITLPGFYDGVPELPDALRESWAKLGFSEADVPRRGRPLGAGRREGPLGARDDLVAADLRGQRHGRRLPGRRLQDGDPGAGAWPRSPSASSSTRTRTRSAPPSASTCNDRIPADCTVEFHEHGSGTAVAFDTSGAGLPEDARRADRRMGQGRRLRRRRRLDPGDDADQEQARRRRGDGRLRPRRRPHPQPEREVRAQELPQGHPLLGAHPGVPRVVTRRILNRPARRRRQNDMRMPKSAIVALSGSSGSDPDPGCG